MFRKITRPALLLALAAGAHAQQAAQPAATPQPTPKTQTAQPAPKTQAAQPAQTPAPPQTHLKVGDPAPDFTLRDTEGKEVKLSDFRNKKSVVLAFYVLAFTGG
jgi:cytochrome oxidase Cu insertion factor (SCO1/SenC/PrrC family)